IDYDMRHGYRGAQQVLWPQNGMPWDTEQILSKLKTLQVYGPLNPGVVLSSDAGRAQVMLKDGSTIDLTMDSMRWARKFISDRAMGPAPRAVNGVVHAGEQIWVRQNKDRWMLSQIPDVNSALVALNPADGAVIALVGGFDFELSKFNRVTQSLRQVGSSIKPLLYTAALDKGLTLSSLLNDLP
ncbi:penicillin-binding protein 1A, partial [Morganella morganii]